MHEDRKDKHLRVPKVMPFITAAAQTFSRNASGMIRPKWLKQSKGTVIDTLFKVICAFDVYFRTLPKIIQKFYLFLN